MISWFVAMNPTPRLYKGVMISSTFTDLKEHWDALIHAIKGQGLTDVAMVNDSAKPGVDVIDSSLCMVRDASAYIGIIGRKYGQIPPCPARNPSQVSITELEFNEAQRLTRPILLFIMGENHLLRSADIETEPVKVEKLNAFRERAKQMSPDSPVHRIYATFDSLEEFKEKIIHAVANLRRYLDATLPQKNDPIPVPPAFYAEPPYIGSHKFVGRQAQLDVLSDWAAPANQHPVLLFDAIGGSGKSMLAWEWTKAQDIQVRGNWAGLFWYSFYERGAIMADFCCRALAYITCQPLDTFRKLKTPELADRLLHQLRERRWLLVLDGLERVLVAYHRMDAAHVADEEAYQLADQIAHRDPCAAIRPEDDDLLHALAAANPSKVLITSRLVPRVLLNPARQPIPGVLRVALPGLQPADAEALLRSSGVTGASEAIQNYLRSHCDFHPLVTGILAGLINDYFPARGEFDAWAADPASGGQLNLANLDLIHRRDHILKAALAGVPKSGRQVLSVLALLSEAVDYATLTALSPKLRPDSIRDLELRGLLQFDRETGRYDLHAVVRGIAFGQLRPAEKNAYGQRVVDHFSSGARRPYQDVKTLDDVRDALRIVRTLLKMGRFQQASDAYRGNLSRALLFNLEEYMEALSLLRSFFPQGWAILPRAVDEDMASYLTNSAGNALRACGEFKESLSAYGASLTCELHRANWSEVSVRMSNISNLLLVLNRLAQEERCLLSNLTIATLSGDNETIFIARKFRFRQLARIGQWTEAQALWDIIDAMGRDWNRNVYRPGDAEQHYAHFRFWQGDLSERHLTNAERLASDGMNRPVRRILNGLRGQWHLERDEWALAAESLRETVSMARAVGNTSAQAETQLAFAKFQLGQLANPRGEAERLAKAKRPAQRALAELWLAIGDLEKATKHALAAYKWAWADGEPYVHRYELTKARAVLEKLGVEMPNLTRYDPAKDERLSWEDDVAAAIETLRAEKDTESRST
jgi:hypothetical protein